MQVSRRQSALSRIDAQNTSADVSGEFGCWLGECQSLQLVNLRGYPDDQLFQQQVNEALGIRLPIRPNTVTQDGPLRVCWLGPDWWLVMAPASDETLQERLGAALAHQHTSLSDLTGGQTLIEIGGRTARDVLASACTLDLHPTQLPVGCCAQTQLAHTVVLIVPTIQEPEQAVVDIVVRRSFAEHLVRWLMDAAGEDGYAFRQSV